MKNNKFMNIVIVIVLIVLSIVVFVGIVRALSPAASDHSVIAYLNSNSIDLVYSETTKFEYVHKIAFDFMNIPAGHVDIEVYGVANFIVPKQSIHVRNGHDEVIVVLGDYVYKGFEQKDFNYTVHGLVDANLDQSNWADANEKVRKELDKFMRNTFIQHEGNRIKANIADKLQTQLNAKFKDVTVHVRWTD